MTAMLARQRPGFLLLEVLIGIAVFSVFASGVGYTLLYGQENTIMSGDRVRAVQYTEQALEAVRAIRDESFASVTAGQHGVWLNRTTKKWAFSGSQVTHSGGYVTHVTVTPRASDLLLLTAQTTWKHGYNRSGSVLITSEISDWRESRPLGNWSSVSVDGTYSNGATPAYNDIVLYSGSYLFLATSTSEGLHVIDVRDTSAPTRVNNSLSLGFTVYDAVILGSVLYMVTSDNSQELQAYNITSPATFSIANRIGTYNLQGSDRGRSITAAGDKIYVGTTANPGMGDEEFFVFQVTPSGGITLMDALEDSNNGYEMIALSGTAAYAATTRDTYELRVLDVESGSNVTMIGGYNLSDRTQDGLSIAISGTSALLGTAKGTSIQEVVLFDLEQGGLPNPPPGPWYHEGSGSVMGLDMDPTRCYGFISALSGRKAFQVFHLRDTSSLAEVATYNLGAGVGRGLLYDLKRDRVYMITDRSLVIFKPGAATNVCP